MGYCTTTDVQYDAQQLQLTLSTTSTPTLAAVTQWIAEITAEIDSVLRSAGVEMATVTGNDYLKLLAVFGVGARVFQVKLLGGEGSDNTARDYRARKYEDGLKALKEHPEMSGGSLLSTSGSDSARSDFTSGFTNTRSAFTRDGREW